MTLLLLAVLIAVTWFLKSRDQRRRIALLGSHLAQYQIEKHMEALTQGYLRALGEDDPERSQPIWNMLRSTAHDLNTQFQRFAADFANTADADARVSTLPVYMPLALSLFPRRTFDMRKALAIHARGIRQAIEGGEGTAPKAQAFTVSAELFLMQHTCHWFCKSKTVASARMLGRHKTTHEQLMAAVAPATRQAYAELVGIR